MHAVEFDLGREELEAALSRQARLVAAGGSRVGRATNFLFPALLTGMAVSGMVRWYAYAPATAALIGAIVAAFVCGLLLLHDRGEQRRRLDAWLDMEAPFVVGRQRYEFNDDGVRITTASGESLDRWSAFPALDVSDTLVQLYRSIGKTNVIPLAAIDAPQREAFVAYLRGRIPVSAEELLAAASRRAR